MVVWTATDIKNRKVQIFGWNSVCEDMTVQNMKYVKTLVDNFQLNADIPVRSINSTRQEDGWQLTTNRRSKSQEELYIWRGCFY